MQTMAIDPLPQLQLINRVPQWWMDITPHDILEDDEVEEPNGPHDVILQVNDRQRQDIVEVDDDKDTRDLHDILQLHDQGMRCPSDISELNDQDKIEYLTDMEDPDHTNEETIHYCSTGVPMEYERQSVTNRTISKDQESVTSVYMTDEEVVQEVRPSSNEFRFERTQRREILLQARRNTLAQDAEEEDIQFRLLQRRRHPGLRLRRQQQHEEDQDHSNNEEKMGCGGEQRSVCHVTDKSRRKQDSSSSIGIETQDQNDSLHYCGNFERALIAILTSMILPFYQQQSSASKEGSSKEEVQQQYAICCSDDNVFCK